MGLHSRPPRQRAPLLRAPAAQAEFGFITKWGDGGDVAVDAAGNVYAADSSNHRIQKFTSDGTLITQWGS